VAGESSDSAQKLSELLHHLQVDNELVHSENEGLREALVVKKKHKKHGRALDLQQREEYHGGAVLWSSRKVREANVRWDVKDQEEHQEKLAKANRKELREAAKLQKEIEKEERRVPAAKKKVEQEKEKAEKAAKRERDKQERDSRKAVQQSQSGKRKA
jgi:hypothetical protein